MRQADNPNAFKRRQVKNRLFIAALSESAAHAKNKIAQYLPVENDWPEA